MSSVVASSEEHYAWEMKKLGSEMRQALFTRTGKNTQWVFLGEFGTAIIGFLTNILLLRKMSVEEYGLFSLFLSTMMLLSGFMHLGWTETYVRFGSKYLGTRDFGGVRAFAVQKAMWGILVLTGLVIIGAPWLSTQVLKREGYVIYVQLAALGALIHALFAVFQNDFRVHQNISALVRARVGSSTIRLVLGLGALMLGAITLPRMAAIYLLSTVLFIAVPLFRWFRRSAEGGLDPEIKKEMKAYNSWIFVSFLTTTIIGNIDSHFLAHYHDNQTLSAFAAAGRLTLPLQMMVLSMTTTLLPRLSAAKGMSEIRFYLRRVSLFLVPLGLLVLLAMWLAPPLLIWIAGGAYSGITSLLQLQILMSLVILLTNPIGLVVNAWGWSRLLAFLNFFQLGVDLVLDLLWIPRWGATGAVMATLVVNLIGTATIYGAVWYGLRTRK